MHISDRKTLEERQKNAYKKILMLAPNMINTIGKLCNASQDNDEELHDSIIIRFIEVVSSFYHILSFFSQPIDFPAS
jgi:hypothetical protein